MNTRRVYVIAALCLSVTSLAMIAAISNYKIVKANSTNTFVEDIRQTSATSTQPETGNPSRSLGTEIHPEASEPKPETPKQKTCVFRTVMGEEPVDSNYFHKTTQRVHASMEDALEWLAKAQLNNGGYGAGSHARQNIMDPHAVKADPATTAMAAMAFLRYDGSLQNGRYSKQIKKAMMYLMEQVENAEPNSSNITDLTGTQIQTKLGQNIDVALTSQFFTNSMDFISDSQLKARVKKCNQICVNKIQNAQADNGSTKGAGWAGVLQSSFAANALETAQEKGVKVDEKKLDKARDYQKQNFDADNNNVKTEDGAGVMLYSISSSSRASAKEARVAKEKIQEAKKAGKIKSTDVSTNNLMDAGLTESEALRYETAYKVNQAASKQAQRDDVMTGFGNDGGEEFLSHLQTGEGMIMSKDMQWKKWYDNVSGKLLKAQNNDGSWNGHHCITSPVFCTATCLLILSVNNDVEHLMAIGKEKN
jgi:hypothetical protein